MGFVQMFRGYSIVEKDGIFSARVNGKVILSSPDIKALKLELKKIPGPLSERDSFVKSVDILGDR
jgi:hypothetical protein